MSRRTAWCSYMSASAPYVIAPVELIVVLDEDSVKKTDGSEKNDITKQEFMDWTNGVWTFPGQSKKGNRSGHQRVLLNWELEFSFSRFSPVRSLLSIRK